MTPPIRMVSVPRSAVERLILAADSYGVRYLDSDDLTETAQELQDATEAMKDALTAAPVREEGGVVDDALRRLRVLRDQYRNGTAVSDPDEYDADELDAILSAIEPALATREEAQPVAFGEPRKGAWAALASYCGGETESCTDLTPCIDCLKMMNVFEGQRYVCEMGAIPALTAPPAPEAEKLRVADETLADAGGQAMTTSLRGKVAAAIREHVKVDATGLSPAVASVFLTGIDHATDAILAALASSGDHAELARLAETAEWMADGDLGAEGSVLLSASVAAEHASDLKALIAEVAALRGGVAQANANGASHWSRATEAERKLAEADKALELAAIRLDEIYEAAEVDDVAYRNEATIHSINGLADVAQAEIRTFLSSKEAERG